jgi:hypothetical protein
LTSEKHFVLDKTLFKKDFYSTCNSTKRIWFFQNFLEHRSEIQKQFFNFIELYKIQILFFDWFELYYASEHHIPYPFASIKHACSVTSRSKTPVWNLTSGPTVESEHPPLRNIQITHNNQAVEAAPYKLSTDDTLSNTKHIINQNNFTNTNLNTLGKQLTRLEKQIQRTTTSLVGIKTSTDLKLKSSGGIPLQLSPKVQN